MRSRWGILSAILAFLLPTLAFSAVGTLVSPLLDQCSALTAAGGANAAKLAQDLERRLRLAMAWPEKGPLVVVEAPPSPDGIPTYQANSPEGLGAVLRILLPDQSAEAFAREAKALEVGFALDLGPEPVDVETPGVLALRDLPGEPVERRAAAPVKELVAAFRKLHAHRPTGAMLETRSLVADLRAAVRREKTGLGAQADVIEKGLERLENLLAAGTPPPKVPCLRHLPEHSGVIDRGGNVRFYFWNEAGLADPYEDYAEVARRLAMDPAATKDLLGRLLQREVKASDMARLSVYRSLRERVTVPSTATARELLRLAPLFSSAEWERWLDELI